MFLGVQTNDLKMVKYYLDEGVDVNYQHPEYMTSPLIEAIVNKYPAMVKLLIENGADVKLKEAYTQVTPLRAAEKVGNKEIYNLIRGKLERE
jgi:ankyrin repeat protein